MARKELDAAEEAKLIPCSTNPWDPYPPNTVVFVFVCRHEAKGFVAQCNRKDPVIVTLDVDGALLELDASAERIADAARRLREIAPEYASVRIDPDAPRWESSHAHHGPIPIPQVVETWTPHSAGRTPGDDSR